MDIEQKLREVNEALLISSVQQHELTAQAQHAETAMRASENRFRTLFELGPVAVYTCDAAGRIVEYNRRAVDAWGRTPAIGDNAELYCGSYKMYLPDGSPLAHEDCRMAEVLRGTVPQIVDAEAIIERPDGSRITVLANIRPLKNEQGEITGAINCLHDITDRKRALTELQEKSDLLQAVTDGIPDAVFVKDRQGRYLLFNRAAADFVGRPIEEVLGHDDTELFSPIDARRVMERDQRVMINGIIETDEEILTAVGVTRIYLATKAPYRDRSGNCAGVIGISRDITDRKRAEEVLQLRDRAIQAVTQGIVITDISQPDNPIIYSSPEFERMTGYNAEEILGRNCRFLQGPDTDPETIHNLRQAVQESRQLTVEVLNYRKDGKSFWNELSISPVRDAHGRLTNYVGISTDVTQRRQLEEQYRQSQKLEAIGRLAGGVAHDFNNLLTVILGYCDVLLDSPPAQDESRDLLEEIKRAGERAAGLTNQLLLFSRKQVQEATQLDLNDLVRNTEKMLGRVIGEDIRLITNLDPKLGSIRAVYGQLEQVLLNLTVNARDAMPNGGKLVIETNQIDVDVEYAAAHHSLQPGLYAMLKVIDTGEGIPDDIREHIFEPFFTTKGVGQGTGLGLPVVHSVVKHSGGHIEVESQPGKGASFSIYLPCVKQLEQPREISRIEESAPSGSEGILLVEDEMSVAALGQLILEECGYSVFKAGNAEEALTVYANQPSTIQLLVTDVVLPGLNGRMLAEKLLEFNPQLKVLYVSGYMDDDVLRRGIVQNGVAFLQKPYSRKSLAKKVREVLEAN